MATLPSFNEVKIGVIGLGYVGLPLAVAFAEFSPVVGFDIDETRLKQLRDGIDRNGELDDNDRARLNDANLTWTSSSDALKDCNVFIVTVPTPIDESNNPDLAPLRSACNMLGEVLKKGDTVIFESTVYPMTTEEVCVPLLEEQSGLKFNEDFFVGYSPERINPGDRHRRLKDIVKVTSGSTKEVAEFVDALYRQIINAGTHAAPSIRVAEAAKVVENIQRDVNIALMNELAMIFHQMDIDTQDVLSAAKTKWNFLDFKPGLVGGHCISVDPYYLTHKATSLGYHPELILASRRINNRMAIFVAADVIKTMAQKGISVLNSRILIAGLAFKENTNDLRNTKVIEIARELRKAFATVDIWDPIVDAQDAVHEFDETLIKEPQNSEYDAIVVAVPHDEVMAQEAQFRAWLKPNGVLYDVKGVLAVNDSDGRL